MSGSSEFCGICYASPPNGYYRTQWLCNVTAFPIDAAYERGMPDGLPNREGVIPVRTAADLPDDCELVVLSPKTARIIQPTASLGGFIHPKRAIYFFGADTTFLSEDELGGRVPDHVLWVPNKSDQECNELYSFVIGAIVLFDRWVTRG